MANPQKENGHVDLANEIVEVLAKTNLNKYEVRYLWVLWRKTYGWHKKDDVISNSQFVEATGIKKQHVWRTEQRLLARNIVTRIGYKLSFQKDYTRWSELPTQVTVTRRGNKVTNSGIPVTYTGIKVTCTGGHKRNYTKETITKENIATEVAEWSFRKQINKMASSKKDPRMWVIALYWVLKGFRIESKAEYSSALKRELRPAGELTAYPKERLKETMAWLKANADFKWTLETVGKYINENLNKIQGKKGFKII
jgi:phage replication O-like protein O